MPCNSSRWTSTRRSFMRAGIRGRTQSRFVSLFGTYTSPTLIYCDAYRLLPRTICSCTAPRERNFAPRYGHPPQYAHLPLGHDSPCPLHIFGHCPPLPPTYPPPSPSPYNAQPPQFYHTPKPPLVCCTYHFFLLPSPNPVVSLVLAKAQTTPCSFAI